MLLPEDRCWRNSLWRASALWIIGRGSEKHWVARCRSITLICMQRAAQVFGIGLMQAWDCRLTHLVLTSSIPAWWPRITSLGLYSVAVSFSTVRIDHRRTSRPWSQPGETETPNPLRRPAGPSRFVHAPARWAAWSPAEKYTVQSRQLLSSKVEAISVEECPPRIATLLAT